MSDVYTLTKYRLTSEYGDIQQCVSGIKATLNPRASPITFSLASDVDRSTEVKFNSRYLVHTSDNYLSIDNNTYPPSIVYDSSGKSFTMRMINAVNRPIREGDEFVMYRETVDGNKYLYAVEGYDCDTEVALDFDIENATLFTLEPYTEEEEEEEEEEQEEEQEQEQEEDDALNTVVLWISVGVFALILIVIMVAMFKRTGGESV